MNAIDPYVYQALAIKHALKMYAVTGMKANRDYTPKNMIRTAEKITGLTFKPRDYMGAHDALQQWLDERK